MLLQDYVMITLMNNIRLGSRIRNATNISQIGYYALDASEKNKGINGTLAYLIDQLTSALATERTRINQLASSGTTASDGELTDIRIGFDGKTYTTAGQAVRSQIQNYRDISVGSSAPTQNITSVWLDTNPDKQVEGFYVPEIKDDTINSTDTWSSSKIQNAINAVTPDVAVGESSPTSSEKIWIDTNRLSEATSFTVPEIKDDQTNATDTWSSSKIANEILNAKDDVLVGESGTKTNTKLWIDTSAASSASSFTVPEIKDDQVNATDTWSSSKIQAMFNAVNNDIYIGTANPTSGMTKLWIDLSASQEYFWVPQIDDEVTSVTDTWSSSKIQSELNKIKQFVGMV